MAGTEFFEKNDGNDQQSQCNQEENGAKAIAELVGLKLNKQADDENN